MFNFFLFFGWVPPTCSSLFNGWVPPTCSSLRCDTIVLDYYPIITYNYSIALLVTTAIKTQVIMGLAPEKASTGLTCGNRRLVRLNARVLILGHLTLLWLTPERVFGKWLRIRCVECPYCSADIVRRPVIWELTSATGLINC